MSDERPADQEAIWQQLRAVEPPTGAQQRVLRALEARLPRRRRAAWFAVPAAVIAAAVIAVVVLRTGGGEATGPLVVSADGARQGERPIAAGERVGGGPIRVDGSLRVALDRAAVEVIGPATVELSRARVELREGRLDVDGEVEVAGPTCSARIRGRGRVELRRAELHVTVFAGSAELVPPETSCVVIEPPPPITASAAAAAPSPREAPVAPPAAPSPIAPAPPAPRSAPKPAPPPPSELAQQTEAYWAAQRVRERDPQAALELLRAFSQRWPRAPIRHEVDLAIVDLLVRLDRTDAAQRAAREFLRLHPDSPRAADVRRIAEGAP